MTIAPEDQVRERIEDWRRRLIDLTYRNRLIRYRKTVASTIEIETPSLDQLLADPERKAPWRFYFPPELANEQTTMEDAAAAFVDEAVTRGAEHRGQPPRPDEIVVKGETSGKRVNRILENLARKSNAEFQDKALRILYIAAGFLHWVDPVRDESLVSPLILVPVELRRLSASQPYELFFIEDEEITVNPSLTEKLRRDVGRDLPADWAWEDKPIDVELDEIEQAVRGTGWSVRRDAALGLFSFQKFVMYRDLLDNETAVANHPIIQALARTHVEGDALGAEMEIPVPEELDDVQPPESDFSVRDADATQRLCLEAARRGQSFVMQGPPGTGKSQTIANIIADAIGNGRRVLFVSEKAAALDVVHKRLSARGLDEFSLLLHGERAARREVVEELHRSLTEQLVPRPGMTSHELERLGHLREILNSSAQLVHLPLPELGDRSLRDLLGQLAHLHDAPSVTGAPEASSASGSDVRREYQQLSDLFHALAERWRVSAKRFVWRGYVSERFSGEERGKAIEVARALTSTTDLFEDQAQDVARLIGWQLPINARAVDQVLELGAHVQSAPALTDEWLNSGAANLIRSTASEASKSYEVRAAGLDRLRSIFPDRSLEQFRVGLRDDVDAKLGTLSEVAGRGRDWELLTSLRTLRPFVHRAPQLLNDITTAAVETGRLLGQPGENFTLSRMDAVARLASLAFRTESRPDSEWLVRAGIDRAENALEDSRADLERYQSTSARLFEVWHESVLDLDMAGLVARFSTDYTGRLARLRGAYRRDVKLVKSVRKDGRLPQDAVTELQAVAELQALGLKIDTREDRCSRAFGVYHKGRESDPNAIEAALRVAREVLELASSRSELAVLASQVCADGRATARVAQLADELRELLAEWEVGVSELQRVFHEAERLDAESPIEALHVFLAMLRQPLDEADAVVNELEQGAVTRSRTPTELRERGSLIADLQTIEDRIERESSVWTSVLGDLFRGPDTDWARVHDVAAWLDRFSELAGANPPTLLKSKLLETGTHWPDFDGLAGARRRFDAAKSALTDLFDDERRTELESSLRQRNFDELRSLGAVLLRDVDLLHDWVEFRARLRNAADRGWLAFVESLTEREVSDVEVVPAFQAAFWNRRLEAAFANDPELVDSGTTYQRWIEEFRGLDRRLIQTGPDRVIAARNRLRRSHVAVPGSQVALLRTEAKKKRRHMPVRQLLSKIPTLLSDLKPCLMMSPLTVSHFLSPSRDFDVVIFDEASQVPPQDAVNCIYRGEQLIVAGDSRQLPPTPFFQVAEAEESWSEDAAEITEDMESVLDSCEALLPQHPLRWHYRSRHEDLIAFSNRNVYDDSLLTFPGAEARSATKGVRFLYVHDGIYDRGKSGTNRREARAAAERVFDHLNEGRTSLGVITFNVAQATAISEELDRLRILHPHHEKHFSGDRLDGVFVKHLESVQGDERDVVVFSVGYGRDAEGKFTMNFGPLNKEGGYRRLNVAVTRARELVEVVASVHASDFSLSENSSRGARLLQEYVRYAEVGGASAMAEETGRREPYDSPLEEAIAEAVAHLGYEAVPRVGVGTFRVDIGIRAPHNPDLFVLAIETDGETYRSTPTARDRDRLREEVLASLGWRAHRIWSLDWVRNRQSEVTRLADALGKADSSVGVVVEAEGDELPNFEREERLVEDLRDALESGRVDWVIPYERAELPHQPTSYEFHESVNRDTQRDLVVQLLEVEAPVHVDYAIRRLYQAWGLRRGGHRVQNAARIAVNMAVRKGLAEQRGEFLWLPEQELEVVREPNWDDERTFRDISEIPPEEIDFAFAKLLDSTGDVAGAHLIPEVARVLGFDRVGGTIRELLEARLANISRAEGTSA